MQGYTSYMNALRRIPFEEGPYFLFKNSAPIYVKNFFSTFTLFYAFDFMKDKASWMWRVILFIIVMIFFIILFVIFIISWVTCLISLAKSDLPLLHRIWHAPLPILSLSLPVKWSSFGPRIKGACALGMETTERPWAGSGVLFSKLDHEFSTNYFPGFFKNYFYNQFPWMFMTLMLADSLGIFSYWQVDMYSGAGTNSSEDNFSWFYQPCL